MSKTRTDLALQGGAALAPFHNMSASGSPDALADWIRLPKPKQRLGGLSRSTWNELLDSGKVLGLKLKKEKARRGIRLIHRPSAERYLMSLMNFGNQGGPLMNARKAHASVGTARGQRA